MSASLKMWHQPDPNQLGRDVFEFLERLGGPSCLHIKGVDSSRNRFVVTLLHGNEPSGAMAVHHYLCNRRYTPPVDMYFVIANVQAALTEPIFSFRHLPGARDLNRCFSEPYHDEAGQLAKQLLDLIHSRKPEALIDIHNTSGVGPSFAVAVHLDQRHDALTSFFTDRLIITDLRLGALMELSERDVPTVTIECGGAQDETSHKLASEGLLRYIDTQDLFVQQQSSWPLDILHNPVRLEFQQPITLGYSDEPCDALDICIRIDIEHFNFSTVDVNTPLAWLNDKAWSMLCVHSPQGEARRDDYFRYAEGRLYPAVQLTLFMITANPAIALSDCLLYAVEQASG